MSSRKRVRGHQPDRQTSDISVIAPSFQLSIAFPLLPKEGLGVVACDQALERGGEWLARQEGEADTASRVVSHNQHHRPLRNCE